ncbi:MAG TPA: deoxyhypusine synthase [Nanoarchaeota archaeon]|nr:MAG: deoxyhypusine synthase [archaeon GW2011_AR6]MBS3082627.1 deoxyhypusine synthase [Candidatus Pacearchaeota archaeon]HIH17519.1 deoxyhypusine synthase [Nanoarchaeota archaeon]HIH33705.1 deoxyhypusine synthase [Nanoarchaeota archaeon]HIH51493.1 deoxyhypusine synthase [Nanoarchaeota archaeon]
MSDKIKGPDFDKELSIPELVASMSHIGFQATELGKSAEILKKIKRDKALLFLTFTSNMTSSGLREVFAWLCKERIPSILITTVGSIEEDIMKASGEFLAAGEKENDAELREQGLNRIYNILVSNEHYTKFESFMEQALEKTYVNQKKEGRQLTPSELFHNLGKELDDENSILFQASKNGIPIFCPAVTDGSFGIALMMMQEKHKDFGLDIVRDMKKLYEITTEKQNEKERKTAAIVLGGGVPKHHAILFNSLKGGLDYAIYITTSSPESGSLSGAPPEEAMSWGKVKAGASFARVKGDATILFPLLAYCMKKIWKE